VEPERWREIERVYHLAREQAPGERTAILDRTCGANEDLRREVESLLNHGDAGEEYLDAAVQELAAKELPGAAGIIGRNASKGPDEAALTMIGRYRLLRKIGEGGMGVVWLAEQEEPVQRRVALKLVKAGMNRQEVIARFESERQALALMEHPAIARVLDAGSTPYDVPYFVMEYVDGVLLTTYCDHKRLSIRQRLELFIQVCEGVQHAHQKAIIHRDLKPSNILVVEVDGRATPKIIDFGVAKALTGKLTADTMFTRVGVLVGTPEYMSPEQADWSSEDIDTRADIYSLGVIFHELLTGRPPLQLQKGKFDEFLRRLREEEAAKPSVRIRALDRDTAAELAQKRQTDAPALSKQIRGDLDSIAHKALEKDRSRRYGSPSEFAMDIRRYLSNEVVAAVPPSAVYRAGKFARRYRGALAVVAAFLLVLTLAAGVSIWQSIRAARQRDRADAESAVAQAVTDFLQNDLLAQASSNTQARPAAKPDPDLKVRTALDRAAARIAGKFERQPEVEAAIRDTIGQTYIDLGLYDEAQKQLERALNLHRQTQGAENPKTLKTISRLGRVASFEGNDKQAETLHSQILPIQRRMLGYEHPDTLATMNNLGDVFNSQGNYDRAESLISQTLEIRRRVLGAEHHDTLDSMNDLATVYQSQGKFEMAESLYGQTLEIMDRVVGSEHPDTLVVMNNLAGIYGERGKFTEAERLLRRTVEIMGRVLGAEHPLTLETMDELGDVYSEQGKYAQASALLSQTLKTQRRVLGPGHYDTLDTLSSFASMHQREGNYALAEAYAKQALAGQRQTLGPEDRVTIESAADLALAYQSLGKFAKSAPLAHEALEFYRNTQPDDWSRFRAESLVGASLAGQKKFAEAEPLLLDGYQGMVARKTRIPVPDWYHLARARDWIVQLYQGWNKPVQAAEWRKKSLLSVADSRKELTGSK
jgi:tetratricopeptide (TPR) repeat protein